MFLEEVIPWFFLQPLRVTQSQERSLQHCSSAPPSHLHNMCWDRSVEEGNPGQGDWEWGGQSQHGLHFNCQASLWMEHLDSGLPSLSKVTLPHISSPLLKSFSHSLLLSTLLKRLFCTFRLDLHTKTAIPAPHWSSEIVPTRSFTLQTLTSVLPDQHCQQESSTNTAINHRAH